MAVKSEPNFSRLPLGRRRALILLGAAAIVPLFVRQGRTASTGAEPQLLSDGQLDLTLGFVFPDTPSEALQAEIGSSDRNMMLALPCTVPLLIDGERKILFDAGSGPHFMDNAGTLLESMQAAGIGADQITDIVFTHCHPDHLWGVTDDFDELSFPNATYHLRHEEFEFWNNPDIASQIPEEIRTFAVGAAARLPRIADQTQFFSDGAEILPGIEAMATPGHTPGHTSFVVHMDGDPVMLTGDVVSHAATVAHPDWHWGTDQNPKQASETRMRVLDRLRADKMRALTYHMDPPGIGRVVNSDGMTRWVSE